jgi:hypothetical protein
MDKIVQAHNFSTTKFGLSRLFYGWTFFNTLYLFEVCSPKAYRGICYIYMSKKYVLRRTVIWYIHIIDVVRR